MNNPTDDREPARREASLSLVRSRAAKALVDPFNRQLGAWQAEAVKLETRAARLKAAGRVDPAVAEATRSLLEFTLAQSSTLKSAAAEAPEEIARHNRVTDTLKVLAMLTERLERTLSDLSEVRDKD